MGSNRTSEILLKCRLRPRSRRWSGPIAARCMNDCFEGLRRNTASHTEWPQRAVTDEKNTRRYAPWCDALVGRLEPEATIFAAQRSDCDAQRRLQSFVPDRGLGIGLVRLGLSEGRQHAPR